MLIQPDWTDVDEETKKVVAAAVKTTAVWYKASEKVVNDELNTIALSAMDTKSGEVNDGNLSKSQKTFLSKYIKSQEEWEELAVVASHRSVGGVKCSEKGESILLNINRPLAVGISDTLAKLILKGAYLVGGDEGKISEAGGGDVEDDHGTLAKLYDEDFFSAFGKAFGKAGVCYVGGPDEQHLPGVMLHGVAGLHGSVELVEVRGGEQRTNKMRAF